MTADGGSASGADSAGSGGGAGITRVVRLLAIAGIALILLLLILALAAALTAAEAWAPFIQIFRDVFLLILILESILLITAFAILMLQAAAFLMLLKTEIKPILDNARQTTRTTKATAQFVNKNAVDPLIQIKSFFAGLLAFIRELIQIRALLDAGQEPQAQENEDDG